MCLMWTPPLWTDKIFSHGVWSPKEAYKPSDVSCRQCSAFTVGFSWTLYQTLHGCRTYWASSGKWKKKMKAVAFSNFECEVMDQLFFFCLLTSDAFLSVKFYKEVWIEFCLHLTQWQISVNSVATVTWCTWHVWHCVLALPMSVRENIPICLSF